MANLGGGALSSGRSPWRSSGWAAWPVVATGGTAADVIDDPVGDPQYQASSSRPTGSSRNQDHHGRFPQRRRHGSFATGTTASRTIRRCASSLRSCRSRTRRTPRHAGCSGAGDQSFRVIRSAIRARRWTTAAASSRIHSRSACWIRAGSRRPAIRGVDGRRLVSAFCWNHCRRGTTPSTRRHRSRCPRQSPGPNATSGSASESEACRGSHSHQTTPSGSHATGYRRRPDPACARA